MIYDENKKQNHLNPELFRKPTSEYRGTPFWAWNCELSADELKRQIDVFKEMGLGGYHMHVRTGLSTEYLSDEFMSLIKTCVDHGEENEMISWLYDEDRWPSGAAGGIVTKDHQYRARHITFSSDVNFNIREETLVVARFDVVLDENKMLKSYRLVGENDTCEGTLWTVYREIASDDPWYNGEAYLDTLNKKAVERFIEVTHERYAEVIGDRFGKSVPAIFTDEPQFSHKRTLPFADSKVNVSLPWTDDIEETYFAEYGDSLIAHLPELLWDIPGDAPSLTRYRYHDHIAERFASAFADTCGKWCDDHGILLTGHMMEEPTLKSQTAALGEAMRSYRSFGLPGIDMLCARFEFTTAKQTQSAVHQYGRPGMLSELYGVTGWDFDFRGHKLHGDWQAALGVTVRVPHLSWVSMKGNAKRDYPASISYQSSWYSEYSYVEDHFARVNTALTRGTPLVKIGVIHPVESYWLHWGPEEQTALVRSKLDNNFTSLTSWLCRGSSDFDFICESLLPSLCKKGSAPLNVGEMNYDVIIVPECETLRSTTLERLEEFKKCGGKLIFMGDAPKYENALPSARGKALYDISDKISFNEGALLAEIADYRIIEIRNRQGALTNNLLHQIRRDTDGEWLFIAHASEPYNKDMANSQQLKITFFGKRVPELWNTLDGSVSEIPYRYEGNKTIIELTLYDYDSVLIYFKDEEGAGLSKAAPTKRTSVIASTPYEVSYRLTEDNVLLLDRARYALDGGELRDSDEVLRLESTLRREIGLPLNVGHVVQPWAIKNTVVEHTIDLEFEIESEIDVESPILALEDADVAKITFNGEKVVYSDLGYYVDIAIRKTALPSIKKGKNILKVTLPFGERTNVEAMYILGSFGVSVIGRRAKITALPEKLAFDDITKQGLAFYGGAIDYIIPIELDSDAELLINTPHYRAAVMATYLDGERKEVIAYPPYIANLGKVSKGSHEVTVRAYISRHNCFGHIHNADEKYKWIGPDCWRTGGYTWTYEYRLLTEGIISTPIFTKKYD